MISVIVPVQNESTEAAMPLARFAAAPECELLVAGGTEESPAARALDSAGARRIPGAGSRGARLAGAAARARGDILFFVHLDSRPPADALDIIRRTIREGASAGSFSLAYSQPDRRMRWIAAWANLRSRLLRLPFGDQGIFCRRDAYDAAGGFRDMPICDDVDLVRRLRRAGRFVVRPEVTTTSPRRYRERGALRQVIRVWAVLGGYFLGVSPRTLGRWYFGEATECGRGEGGPAPSGFR
jgi:rSAM/selenodomain-associated transferase 2